MSRKKGRSGGSLDPRDPGWRRADPLGLDGLLGTDLSGVFGASPRRVLGSLGLTPPDGEGVTSRSSASGFVEAPDRPDRVSQMPGGAEVVRRRRRERRGELIQELVNVSIGAGATLLGSAAFLVTAGADFVVAGAVAAVAAAGWGYVLGREVLADLGRVKDRSERDAERW